MTGKVGYENPIRSVLCFGYIAVFRSGSMGTIRQSSDDNMWSPCPCIMGKGESGECEGAI